MINLGSRSPSIEEGLKLTDYWDMEAAYFGTRYLSECSSSSGGSPAKRMFFEESMIQNLVVEVAAVLGLGFQLVVDVKTAAAKDQV